MQLYVHNARGHDQPFAEHTGEYPDRGTLVRIGTGSSATAVRPAHARKTQKKTNRFVGIIWINVKDCNTLLWWFRTYVGKC